MLWRRIGECGAQLERRERDVLSQVIKQLTARYILDDHEQLLLCLKRAVKLHEEGMVELGQDGFLGHGVVDLIPSEQLVLVENLHGEELALLLRSNQHHFPKAALPNELQHFEILDRLVAFLPGENTRVS